jgi:hypothetical protein
MSDSEPYIIVPPYEEYVDLRIRIHYLVYSVSKRFCIQIQVQKIRTAEF